MCLAFPPTLHSDALGAKNSSRLARRPSHTCKGRPIRRRVAVIKHSHVSLSFCWAASVAASCTFYHHLRPRDHHAGAVVRSARPGRRRSWLTPAEAASLRRASIFSISFRIHPIMPTFYRQPRPRAAAAPPIPPSLPPITCCMGTLFIRDHPSVRDVRWGWVKVETAQHSRTTCPIVNPWPPESGPSVPTVSDMPA